MKMKNSSKIQEISKFVGSIAVVFLFCCQIVLAADSSVHTVTMKATYRHPITGVIEDSGGESGEAIGQGMVENVVDSKGLLEVDNGNNIYLTMRFNMTDSISKLSFQVQATDASSFSNTQSEKVSEASSNHTVDYRILMPSNDGVIKVSAYVEPMGRSVVFYLQPTNMVAGNQTSFTTSVSAQTTSNESENETVNSSNTSSVLAEETGLTVSDYGKSTEGTQSGATSNSTTENIALATDESVSQTVAAMLAESAANQAAVQNSLSQDDDYIVMEDSAFIQVNRNFWLCLLLEMIVAMVSSGLILMGIQSLIRHFIEEKRKNNWDRGPEVMQDEETYEE